MSRILVMGDIHGAYKGLKQALERCEFGYKNDTLIQLGDVVDGWSEIYECVEELLKINNLIAIRGNHDDWFRTWLKTGQHPCNFMQGGEGTVKSYCNQVDKIYSQKMSGGILTSLEPENIDIKHINFFYNKQQPYYYDKEREMLFVHGGFNRHHDIEDVIHNDEDVLMWDRDLWMAALSYGTIEPGDALIRPKFKNKNNFKEIFIGHTTTVNWKTDKPMNKANIWNLDTGGGFSGKVTIMDIDTKEYWQSDLVKELYPNEKGR